MQLNENETNLITCNHLLNLKLIRNKDIICKLSLFVLNQIQFY